MNDLTRYPADCRKSIRMLKHLTGIDTETIYAMMLMIAALMDLNPNDEKVAYMILEDIGIYPEATA